MSAAGVPRFGFELLLARLLRYRAEAQAQDEGAWPLATPPQAAAPDALRAGRALPDAMDRLRVLRRLQAELGVEAELLLQRGFDKAYRRVVEGV